MPQTLKTPPDLITANRFSMNVDGHEIAVFSELLAITSEVEPIEVHEFAGKEPVVKTAPGRRKTQTVVLKRGKTSSMELWSWHEAAVLGDAEVRKSCSLVMYNADGKPVARYHLANAWPSKFEIGALKAGANEVLMETVTFVCEDLRRVEP